MKLRMVAGALAGAAMAPSLLDSVVTIDEQEHSGDGRLLLLRSRRNPADWASISYGRSYAQDGPAPKRIDFEIDRVAGTVTVLAWQVGSPAVDGLFAPPGHLPVTAVSKADVQRMFVSLFNFAMENAR